MTDHEKLAVALIGSDDSQSGEVVTLAELVAMLYQLGAHYREQTRQQPVLAAAS
jgi:hypothetical protein